MTSDARKRAVTKYDQKTYFRQTVRFKKTDMDLIRQYCGDSLNKFINDAVMEKIERMNIDNSEDM